MIMRETLKTQSSIQLRGAVAIYSVAYGKVVCRLGDPTRETDWELVEVKKIVHQPPQMTFKDRKHKIILNFSRSWRGRGGLLLD